MGQYYKWVNLSKQEVVNPWDLGGVAKAWEWMYSGNSLKAIHWLMFASSEDSTREEGEVDGALPRYTFGAYQSLGGGDIHLMGMEQYLGRWAGDKVTLVGDYDASGAYSGHGIACKQGDGCEVEHYTDITLALVEEMNAHIIADGNKNIHDLLGRPGGREMHPDIVLGGQS